MAAPRRSGRRPRQGPARTPFPASASSPASGSSRERSAGTAPSTSSTRSGRAPAGSSRSLRRPGRTPVVVSLAGGELAAIPGIGYGCGLVPRERLKVHVALRRARAITAASTPMLRAAGAAGFEAELVPLGVEAAGFLPRAPREASAPTRLLHVGSLNRVKDQETLLRAFALALERSPALRLDVVGEDTLGGEIQALATRLGLDGSVTFHGWLPTDEARRLLLARRSPRRLLAARGRPGRPRRGGRVRRSDGGDRGGARPRGPRCAVVGGPGRGRPGSRGVDRRTRGRRDAAPPDGRGGARLGQGERRRPDGRPVRSPLPPRRAPAVGAQWTRPPARRARTLSQASFSASPSASGAKFAFTSPRVGKALRNRRRNLSLLPGVRERATREKPRAGREWRRTGSVAALARRCGGTRAARRAREAASKVPGKRRSRPSAA